MIDQRSLKRDKLSIYFIFIVNSLTKAKFSVQLVKTEMKYSKKEKRNKLVQKIKAKTKPRKKNT